jgi:hypothetical protein
MYRVFVEIERDNNIAEQIMELMDGIQKLTDNSNYRFRYYRSFKSVPLTLENLQKEVPITTEDYNNVVTESNMNNFKNFFNKSRIPNYIGSGKSIGEFIILIPVDKLDFEEKDYLELSKTIDNLYIKLPPASFEGDIFCVGGKGMPKFGKANEYGNLYLKISVEVRLEDRVFISENSKNLLGPLLQHRIRKNDSTDISGGSVEGTNNSQKIVCDVFLSELPK